MKNMLVKYNAACRALAEAKKVDEVKDILDKTVAIKEYARQTKNRALEIDAAEIRIRAEIRLGEMLIEQKETGGMNKGTRLKGGDKRISGGTIEAPPEDIPKLSDLGIDKKLSSRSQKIASIPKKEREEMLEDWRQKVEKENERITTNLVKSGERHQRDLKLKPQEMPDGIYNVIYADPPWKYDFSETKGRDIENKYPTMAVDNIKDIVFPAAENSVLLLWATAPKLNEALSVMVAWEFEYKTHAVWDKQIIGMGYWFRGQHELLLVGVKGAFSAPPPEARYSSVISQKRGKHSKKPELVYQMIEKMFPKGKYLELFARKKHNGKWTIWGNEISKNSQL